MIEIPLSFVMSRIMSIGELLNQPLLMTYQLSRCSKDKYSNNTIRPVMSLH